MTVQLYMICGFSRLCQGVRALPTCHPPVSPPAQCHSPVKGHCSSATRINSSSTREANRVLECQVSSDAFCPAPRKKLAARLTAKSKIASRAAEFMTIHAALVCTRHGLHCQGATSRVWQHCTRQKVYPHWRSDRHNPFLDARSKSDQCAHDPR